MIDDGPGISEYEPKPSQNSLEKEIVPPRVNEDKINEFFEPYKELMEDVVEYSKIRAERIIQEKKVSEYKKHLEDATKIREEILKKKIEDSSGPNFGGILSLIITIGVGYFVFSQIFKSMMDTGVYSGNQVMSSVQNTFMPLFILAGIGGVIIAIMTMAFNRGSYY